MSATKTVVPKTTDFGRAKEAVRRQWELMAAHPIFRVDLSGDALWALYLESFPKGTDPVFRKRTEHDCSCCRTFIRNMGNAVAVIDGAVVSLWDGVCDEPTYAVVFQRMAEAVKSRLISEPFLHRDSSVGTDKNFEDASHVRVWSHFHVQLPGRLHMKGADIPTALGERRTAFDVLLRGLQELTLDSIDATLDMIGQNSLYRGEEHRGALEAFRRIKVLFEVTPEADRVAFTWFTSATASPAVCRIRNTAIGTLLIDLSAGVDLEDAVRKFEALVAPANYKRPTALVTKAMIEKARAAVAELGLLDALERRHAVVEDLRIENLLFVDRDTRAAINGDAFDLVGAGTKSSGSKDVAKLEEVPIDRFIAEILPKAKSVEVFVENRHAGNMVSLIAPVHPGETKLFKWPNPFSWSYAGEVADSIKERVKKAGGSVTGDVLCRLAWSNFDDLDLHMEEPGGGHISFREKTSRVTGGRLDVDMNAGSGQTREPVENIFYESRSRMRPGEYRLSVNQYSNRETKDVGFEVEIDVLGTVHHFVYSKAMRTGTTVDVATIRVSKNGEIEVVSDLPAGSRSYASRNVWGLDTGNFHRVKAAMHSPNYWGESEVGNRHLFLMLEGCAADVPVRGFYNEFLTRELDQHRKVLELVGSKAAIAPADRQLSGLGFSSTQRANFVCRIKGGYNRTINVVV